MQVLICVAYLEICFEKKKKKQEHTSCIRVFQLESHHALSSSCGGLLYHAENVLHYPLLAFFLSSNLLGMFQET